MSSINGKDDLQAWIDLIGDDLPDLATLRRLVEYMESDQQPRIIICGRGANLPIEAIKQLTESFGKLAEIARVDGQFMLHRLISDERRYMLLEPELIPQRRDPFWTQQGKRKKGKRGRY